MFRDGRSGGNRRYRAATALCAAVAIVGSLASCSNSEPGSSGTVSTAASGANGFPADSAPKLSVPDGTVGADAITLPPSTSNPPTTATPTTAPPAPVIPSDVLFDTNQARLKPEAGPYLSDLAGQLRERNPGARLTFVGHTDSRGSEAANDDLSRRRAEAVRSWFVSNGFDPALLGAEGRGERELLAPDTTDGRFEEAAGARNRRVAIIIG